MGSSFGTGADGDLEEEYTSPYQVYKRLIDVTTNELLTPEVLPYEEQIVDLIVDQIYHMKDNMKRLSSKLDSFCIEQHKMELERYMYVISKYLKTRLKKIESNPHNLIKLLKEDMNKATAIMSQIEIEYLVKYVKSIDDFMDRFLEKMPVNMRSFQISEISSNEEMEFDSEYVFVRANKKTSVMVDDPITGQEVISLDKNSQNFLPYKAIRSHLTTGSKDLVLM